MKKTLLIIISGVLSSLLYGQSTKEYLKTVLKELNNIRAVSYYNKSSSSAPGDTIPFNSYENYFEVYMDETDTLLGACFARSSNKHMTDYELLYDGEYLVELKPKKALVDTLTGETKGLPMSPFYVRVKSLINYSLQNLDNTKIEIQYFNDSTQIDFEFTDRIVEFIRAQPYIYEAPGKSSQYQLILNSNLPFKLIRKMPHQMSWIEVSQVKIFNSTDWEFDALRRIPPDFRVTGFEKDEIKTPKLEGQLANDWTLKKIKGDSLSLKDIESKVILLKFTGIGCGPCHISLPFMKALRSEFQQKDLEIISIETWNKRINGIESYIDKNNINYPYLISKEKVTSNYKIELVPTFLILDENRIIQKVILGYKEEETDKTLRKAIKRIL